MNKSDLVRQVAERANITQKDADAVLSAAIEAIMEAVSKGEKVMLVGFGAFEPRVRKGRTGRNPKTGEPLEIPQMTVPAFAAGKEFKAKVA